MGTTLIPQNFVDSSFAIVPHTATHARHIEQRITLCEFARGQATRVFFKEGSDEAVFQRVCDGAFAEGAIA